MPSSNPQRRIKPFEEVRIGITAMATRERGVKRRDVHNRFHGPNRKQGMTLFDAMVRTGQLVEAPEIASGAYKLSAQAAQDRAQKVQVLKTMGVAASSGTLYHPATTKLPGIRQRFGTQPPPLPGGIVRGFATQLQPAKPRRPGEPIVTICPGYTHNHRWQLPPGAIVDGEFTRLGIGRYITQAEA